jgi:enoyl-CoA hydratase/carnithine racemase
LTAAWPLLRTGNPISSAEALKIGLIHMEVEGDVVDAAVSLVKDIDSEEIKVPPIQRESMEVPASLPEVDIGRLSRKTDELLQRAVLQGAKMTLDEGLKHEARILGTCVLTKDLRIGMETFSKFGPKKNAEFCNA